MRTTGTVDVGPVGTPLPPTGPRFFGPQGVLDPGLSQLGYLDEDGVAIAHVPARWRFLARTPAHNEVTFTLLGDVDIAPLTPRPSWVRRALMIIGWARATPMSWVVRVIDDGTRKGLIVPRGEIARLGDLQYSGGEVTATELTINAWPDKDGTNLYLLTDEG